jgi:hypothetical protein
MLTKFIEGSCIHAIDTADAYRSTANHPIHYNVINHCTTQTPIPIPCSVSQLKASLFPSLHQTNTLPRDSKHHRQPYPAHYPSTPH